MGQDDQDELAPDGLDPWISGFVAGFTTCASLFAVGILLLIVWLAYQAKG